MKKALIKFITTAIVVLTVFSVSCAKPIPRVIKESDTYFVINITDSVKNGETLYEYMLTLRENGEMEFADADGMIISINGIKNTADWAECWMLYTTDADNGNTAYGQVEYNGKVYGSSSFGAENLRIKQGESYIWLYQSF